MLMARQASDGLRHRAQSACPSVGGSGVPVPELVIPAHLRPADGRFGSGTAEAVVELGATGGTLLGTSHRRPPVRGLVARIRAGLAELFDAPRRLRGRARQRRFDRVLGRRRVRPDPRAGRALRLRRVLEQVRRRHRAARRSSASRACSRADYGSAPALAAVGRRRRLRLAAERDVDRRGACRCDRIAGGDPTR